jgi:hypothetical protein
MRTGHVAASTNDAHLPSKLANGANSTLQALLQPNNRLLEMPSAVPVKPFNDVATIVLGLADSRLLLPETIEKKVIDHE